MNVTSIVLVIALMVASLGQPAQPSPAAVSTVEIPPSSIQNEDIPETCSAPCVVDAQGNVIFCPC